MNGDKTSVRMLLEKTTRAAVPGPQTPVHEKPEGEYTAYGHGRISNRTQLMLLFRLSGKSVLALPYACLMGVEASDPSSGFTLDFGRQRIRIAGKQLEDLLRLVCQHRVAEIREVNRSEMFTVADDSPVVETIEIQKPAIDQKTRPLA